MPRPPSADQVDRFRGNLDRLEVAPGRIGLAVSGGPDSLALLLLAQAALPGRIAAATVDHRLRRESEAEAAAVAAICASLNVPHDIISIDARARGEGLQAAARRARYEGLIAWARSCGVTALATAHHVDDQAETLVMRLLRGSGVRGLAGIRPVRHQGGVAIVRPLLGWSKAELMRITADAGLTAADDASNRDPRFDRARVRKMLADVPALRPEPLARSAAALRQADEALEWITDALVAERTSRTGHDWIVDPEGLPRELRRRLLERVLGSVLDERGSKSTRPRGLDALLTSLDDGKSGTLAGVHAASDGLIWRMRPAPPRRAPV